MLAYGRALAAWAGVEGALFSWFHALTDIDVEMASAVFFSSRSLLGRHDMLQAAIRATPEPSADVELFHKMLKRARQFSVAKNILSHSLPATIGEDYSTIQLWDIGNERDPEVTVEMVRQARTNFQALASCLSSVWINVSPQGRLGLQTPEQRREECQQLLLELPTEAFAKQSRPPRA